MLSGEILINEQQVQLKIWKVLDLVYLQKLHHIVEKEPVVKYITWGFIQDTLKGYLK